MSSCTLFGCVYITPGQCRTSYADFCGTIDEFVDSAGRIDETKIMGDFNLPGIDWSNSYGIVATKNARLVSDLAAVHELRQINDVWNFCAFALILFFHRLFFL